MILKVFNSWHGVCLLHRTQHNTQDLRTMTTLAALIDDIALDDDTAMDKPTYRVYDHVRFSDLTGHLYMPMVASLGPSDLLDSYKGDHRYTVALRDSDMDRAIVAMNTAESVAYYALPLSQRLGV